MKAANPYLPSLGPMLEMVYRSPDRHYHNLQHIHDCLREFEPIRGECEDAEAVELAIWFHDFIYDPTRHDNEARSAEAAARELSALGAPADLIRRVEHLILATRHTAEPTDTDAKVLVDIDLSILGRPIDDFDRYEAAIRGEYAHVPDEAFAQGRAAVLRRFLDRPTIYTTRRFRERYEAVARKNLIRSLAHWRGNRMV
jgi:predicted metal-dependent HD superfamily phosphohydrolase